MTPEPVAPNPPEETGRPRPARRGYLVPGVIALAVLSGLAAVIDAGGMQHRRPHALAGPDVATLIAESIQTRANAAVPPQVRCPSSTPVRAGLQFVCELSTAGGPQPVRVTETDSQGAFTWRVAPAGG